MITKNTLADLTDRTPVAQLRALVRAVRFGIRSYPLLAYVKYIRRAPIEPGKVSVITPTYNRPQKLREAIESLLAQSYSNWEQIIVSDGPDPRVTSLVASYADRRIQSFSTRRFPVMGNYQRNVALRHATGEFVLYLDDDNIIYPTCLETMVAGFTGLDVAYVVCPIHYGNGELKPTPAFKHGEIDLLNYMVRRQLIERVWGQSFRWSADYFLIRDVSRVSRGVFLDTFIGHHR